MTSNFIFPKFSKKNLTKLLIITFNLLLITLNATAKEITYITIGNHQSQNITELNKVLNKNGYPSFTGNAYYWGTGSRNISGNIVTGSETNTVLETNVLRDNKIHSSYISGKFSSILNVGYTVYNSENFNIYPLVGLGLGAEYLDFYKKPSSTNFEDILKNPENGSSLINTTFVSDIGLAMDYVVRFGKKDKPVGITLGFSLKEYKLVNTPDLNSSGFYIKMFAGYEEGIIPAVLGLFSN
ncbi:MAG: hypothetical protein U0457_03715 [Candidatus Sericytochromatia bacterium]